MSKLNIPFLKKVEKSSKSISICLLTRRHVTIHQWLELHMSRTNVYGPKDVRAIEVRLYAVIKHKHYNHLFEM